jgi:hypothetical protein
MQNDPETQFIKELAEIAGLKKEIRSLKNRVGKMNGRIEQLELCAFQDQISRLDEHLSTLDIDMVKIAVTTYLCYITAAQANAFNRLITDNRQDGSIQNCALQLASSYSAHCIKINHCKTIQEFQQASSSFIKETNNTLKRFNYPEIQMIQ